MSLEEQRACMAPLQLAGQLIMENGGETYRAEETVTRMGEAFGLQEVESFAVPSGLFISYRMEDGNVESSVKRVRRSDTNLSRVDAVNQVSRDAERKGFPPAKALEKLHEIRELPERKYLTVLGAALCAAGFTLMFGGGWVDFLMALALAGTMQGMSLLLDRMGIQAMVSLLLGGLLTALIPMLLAPHFPCLHTEALIAGALMPMLPGLMMTNAIQDTMRGDMVSGLSHGALAILTACLVASGALIAESLMIMLTGGGIG